MADLHDWAVIGPNRYTAPELAVYRLWGTTTTGRKVETSRVVEVVSDRVCITRTGTQYRLVGKPVEIHRGSISHPLGAAAEAIAVQKRLGEK